MNRPALPLCTLAATLLLAGCDDDDAMTRMGSPRANANLLFTDNRLASLDTGRAASLSAPAAVSGLAAGDVLAAIDRRPQNGFLYALGYNAPAGTVQLYTLHPDTLVATAVGSTGSFVGADGSTPVAVGLANPETRFEIDFNPSVDRLRVVSSVGENFRLNPNTGAFVDGDLGGAAGSVAGVNMDGNLRIDGTIAAAGQGTAYTNSRASTATTTQYTIGAGVLFLQNPPNAGTLASPLPLMPAGATPLALDIAPDVSSGAANAAVASGVGALLYVPAGGGSAQVAAVDLTSGQITASLALPEAGATGLALQQPSDIAIVALGADGALKRFSRASPGTVTSVAITGLNTGEALVGLDWRPATGQLIALGVDAAADTATLYRLDPQGGQATALGTPGGIAFVDAAGDPVDLPPAATGYGVDFNPVVDRVRVTTGSGLNLRLNPVNGAAVDGDLGGAAGSVAGTNPDGALNGAATGAGGAAYTNSVAGTAVTTLYTLDAATRSLYLQTPPNAGTLAAPVAVTLGGAPLSFDTRFGFDLQADVRAAASNAAVTRGKAHAALTVAGSTALYEIDLVTGRAVNLGLVGDGTLEIAALALAITHVD